MRLIKYFKAVKILYRSISHLVDMEEIKDIDAFYQEQRVRYPSALGSKTLDLGCGTKPRNPFSAHTVFGVDINDVGISNIVQSDLSQSPIPFENGSMDYITAFDFIEHVPRVIYLPSIRFSFIELMNEIHRVLKPGGYGIFQIPQDLNRETTFEDNTITDKIEKWRKRSNVFESPAEHSHKLNIVKV